MIVLFKNSVVVNIHYGIHTRIAAMIVNKAAELKAKYNINLYIRRLDSKDSLAISMLVLISLKVKEGEVIEISCLEDTPAGRNAVLELSDFISIKLSANNNYMADIDAIIEETTVANEQVLQKIPMGILIIDANSYITTANDYALQIIGKELSEVLGSPVRDIIPNSGLPEVVSTGKNFLGELQQINNHIAIVNRSPIFSGDKIIGAIGVFQDISELAKKLEQSQEELDYYKEELNRHNSSNFCFENIIGSSGNLKDALNIAEKASQSTSTVLIRGESGTGKELIAKAIHNNSLRKDKPFVRVNCAAIPENLLESELFGYEKGAFTGAVKSKPGKFNIANGGTIFLDEIGDMPKPMQVKLLRVLQEMEFESVGGLETQKVDVRVIAATNRKLEEMMKTGEFRDDLYYRLNVISIFLPPLRARKEDINLLVSHFIEKISKKLNKPVYNIDPNCISYLSGYNWPGNIRELENIIERAINMCEGTVISSKDLPFYITNENHKDENLINLRNGELLPIEEYEREIISLAMKKYKSFNKAGKALGLTHRTISLKCQKYGIQVNKEEDMF